MLQAKGATDANVAASVVDNGAGYTLTLTHPTLGTAVIALQKGRESSGGSITIGGVTTGLSTTVQSISVTDSGVAWGGAGGTTLPNAPTGLRIVTRTVAAASRDVRARAAAGAPCRTELARLGNALGIPVQSVSA